jgi:hypothetical protein
MKTRHAFSALLALALLLLLAVAGTAFAATSTRPAVWVAGAVGFNNLDIDNQRTPAFAGFAAKAIGPALPGEDHQPAKGSLVYRDKTGTTFVVSVVHIHAHSATEVHFGGTVVRSSDTTLVGSFAHCVAVDGGTPGVRGDLFSILVTGTDTHVHRIPVRVSAGNLVVRAPGM